MFRLLRPQEPLAIHSPAPDFSLQDQNRNAVALSHFHKRNHVVLVFYPKDKSPVCSLQLKNLSDALPQLRAQGAEVFGINQESSNSHAGFCGGLKINVPLLSDPKKKACRDYRALMLGGLIVNRTVYVIDKQGLIRYAKRGRPPASDILGVLKELNHESPGI